MDADGDGARKTHPNHAAILLHARSREVTHANSTTSARSGESLSAHQLLDQTGPVAGADRQNLIIEIVTRVVEQSPVVAGAITHPDVAAGALLQHEGEVLAPHA